MLHDLKTIISGQIHAKQLELYMDAMDVTNEDVYCDKTRLNQVLLNLLSNAIKFTPAGGTVSVRLKQYPGLQRGSELYEIRVKDNGIGMSPVSYTHLDVYKRQDESLLGQNTADNEVIQAMKRHTDSQHIYHLKNEGIGCYGIMLKQRDYYIYAYLPDTEVFHNLPLSVISVIFLYFLMFSIFWFWTCLLYTSFRLTARSTRKMRFSTPSLLL